MKRESASGIAARRFFYPVACDVPAGGKRSLVPFVCAPSVK
nr:MAG TPA: hypothetical protein [Caudoviricetes sp.]